MSKKVLVGHSTIGFSLSSDEGQLRLLRDDDRKVEPTSRYTAKGYTVSCTDSVYVRLYPPAKPTTTVTAATGTLRVVGQAVEHDVVDVVMLTPDSPTHDLPDGVSNVRIEQIGLAISESGTPVRVNVAYDPVRNQVKADSPCYRALKVWYDQAFTLYLYKFSGSCPDSPPSQTELDAAQALYAESPKYFADGVIMAVDMDTKAHAVLQLDPPECSWTSVAVQFGDTNKDAALQTLMMEIDPRYPPRLVGREGATRPYAECCIRVYPAGAVGSISVTAGIAHKVNADAAMTQQVSEILEFSNSSSAALRYPPASTVSVSSLGRFKTLNGEAYSMAPPGTKVVDVTYTDDGRYTNQRARTLGSNEVAVIDLFSHPLPSHGLAKAEYASTYDLFYYEFAYSGLPGDEAFLPAFALAEDVQGRGAQLRLNGPSLDVSTISRR